MSMISWGGLPTCSTRNQSGICIPTASVSALRIYKGSSKKHGPAVRSRFVYFDNVFGGDGNIARAKTILIAINTLFTLQKNAFCRRLDCGKNALKFKAHFGPVYGVAFTRMHQQGSPFWCWCRFSTDYAGVKGLRYAQNRKIPT